MWHKLAVGTVCLRASRPLDCLFICLIVLSVGCLCLSSHITLKQIFTVRRWPAAFSSRNLNQDAVVTTLHVGALPSPCRWDGEMHKLHTGMTSPSSAITSLISTGLSLGFRSLEYEVVHEVVCAVERLSEEAQLGIQLSLAETVSANSTTTSMVQPWSNVLHNTHLVNGN